MNATGSVLVDTSVVIGYLRHDPDLHRKFDRVEDIYLPLHALGELLYGARKAARREKALDRVRTFAQGCILLPLAARDNHFSYVPGLSLLAW